jgi:hypothetical protein
MPQLTIREGEYYSQADEDAFFGWLKAIPGVSRIDGTLDGLVVTLRSQKLSQTALRELIALHYRYRLPMKALAQFATPQNRKWFRSPKAYWHKAVFG